ncbi:peptidylprolyl isomerase [Microvirga sp. 2MCAF38]|uniref:peptidylprolyl isomerase n=1 Tax=Microvirga sp. 2MCAF38 TaxID=3232989 RepID=UPI003F9D32F9
MSVSSSLLKSVLALGVALPLSVGFASAQTPAPAAPAASAAKSNKVVARVNGVDITEADLAIAEADPALQLPNVSDAQKRDLLIGYMIDLKLGAKAAAAAKVGDTPDFARKLAYNQDKTLLDEYLSQEAKKGVTPEAAKKLYDETVKSVTPEQEVRARHILVENEDEAKKVYARVKGGEDFAKVAGEVSKDPGSKTDGGDLGFFSKDRMVEPFAEAAFKLEPGQISEPVKSQFGWHIIKLEEKRTKPAPSFEEMKEQVNNYLERKTQQDLILNLRKDAKIERLDDKGNLVEQKKQ